MLEDEVRAVPLGDLIWAEWFGSDVRFTFETELSSADQTTLDGIVADHTGAAQTDVQFTESNQIVGEPIDVTWETWDDIGGQPTNAASLLATNGVDPGFVGYAHGRVTCHVKTNGTGAQLKIIECDPTPRDLTSSPFDVPDTAGEWAIAKVLTDVSPAAGDSCFTLQGKTATGVSFEVRRVALTMLYIGP
jgi:hypothetical protein